MRLNQASDFALRVLMLLASKNEPITISDIADELGLVKTHIMKIVAKLTHAGFVDSRRGRIGGISLAKPTNEISIGKVIRTIDCRNGVDLIHAALCIVDVELAWIAADVFYTVW